MNKDIENKSTERLKALQSIAIELMQVTNHHNLLELIVQKGMKLLGCDGGSLYLVHNETHLQFEVALNSSVKFDFKTRLISKDGDGIAAYTYRSGTVVRVDDVYDNNEEPFVFDDFFDKQSGYRTKSILALPLISSKGEKLGVIQLVNKKDSPRDLWPSNDSKAISKMPLFDLEDQELLESFAALASASIENTKLYQSIEHLFKGFVRASVKAIEGRDPTTKGHSERVAILTVDLAQKVSSSRDSQFRHIEFNKKQIDEIQYASLLHDFGKIAVKESTLLKQKKLFNANLHAIQNKMSIYKHAIERKLYQEFYENIKHSKKVPSEIEFANLKHQINSRLEEIDRKWQTILRVNEPSVLDQDSQKEVEMLASYNVTDLNDNSERLLSSSEVKSLNILRGSLSNEERIEIESHVTHTFHFLMEIPWTTDYAQVPHIAYAHHEKLDGKGYPRELNKAQIPDQAKLMTICDIYDALVAADRPYKKALPIERALSILESDAKAGKIDPNFLKLFIDARVFENLEFLNLNTSKKAA